MPNGIMNEQQYNLVKVIQKIRIFQGFGWGHIRRLLRIARIQNYPPGKMIYRLGEPSDEMMVLLKGHLVVTNNAGDVLAEIKAGAPIGEMGVFSGQSRSANIAAVELATGLIIDREGLMRMFAANADMLILVQKNLITVLSERLNEANVYNTVRLYEIHELEKKVEMLEGRQAEGGVMYDDEDDYDEDEYDDEDDEEDED